MDYFTVKYSSLISSEINNLVSKSLSHLYLNYFESINFTENNSRYEEIIFVDTNIPAPCRACQFLTQNG